ncbi:MAG: twin-arginine translocase subunit TatC [Candidatus Paceibacterota bacterium]
MLENIKKFLPFIEELRRRLYTSAVVFAFVFIGGFFSTGLVIKHFVSTFHIEGVTITTTSPFQLTDLAVDLGIFFALIVTIPLAIFQIYSFIFPGLNKREQKLLLLSIPICLLLFVFGFIFGAAILFFAFKIIAKINESLGILNIWDISSYLSQIFITSALLGLLFQFPLILTGLIKLGLFGVSALKKKRHFAWLVVFIITSLLPPTDGLSLIAMSLPMIFLYEITIFVNRKPVFLPVEIKMDKPE